MSSNELGGSRLGSSKDGGRLGDFNVDGESLKLVAVTPRVDKLEKLAHVVSIGNHVNQTNVEFGMRDKQRSKERLDGALRMARCVLSTVDEPRVLSQLLGACGRCPLRWKTWDDDCWDAAFDPTIGR